MRTKNLFAKSGLNLDCFLDKLTFFLTKIKTYLTHKKLVLLQSTQTIISEKLFLVFFFLNNLQLSSSKTIISSDSFLITIKKEKTLVPANFSLLNVNRATSILLDTNYAALSYQLVQRTTKSLAVRYVTTQETQSR